MRRFGRQGRGRGTVVVTRVRPTETPWLELGPQVRPRAWAAQEGRHGAPPRSQDQRARVDTQLMAALAAHHRLARQSRRLTQGRAVPHGTIVNADAPTRAPIGTGTSPGPAPLGRQPGLIAAPAAGCILALQLPGGHPSDARDGAPLVDHVAPAIARVRTRPTPASHARAGALALHDAAVRAALHERGLRSVGLPQTVDPLPPSPSPEDVSRIRSEAGWQEIRTATPVHLASACGDSRPVGDSIMASLLCRGAARLTDKGHRGALVHTGMAVMAHHAATVGRIHEDRLSKRARLFRRRLRLRCRTVNQCHASIN
jgi:hypothetical protein